MSGMGVRRCWAGRRVFGAKRAPQVIPLQCPRYRGLRPKASSAWPTRSRAVYAYEKETLSWTSLGVLGQADVNLALHKAPFLRRPEFAQHVFECGLVGRSEVEEA